MRRISGFAVVLAVVLGVCAAEAGGAVYTSQSPASGATVLLPGTEQFEVTSSLPLGSVYATAFASTPVPRSAPALGPQIDHFQLLEHPSGSKTYVGDATYGLQPFPWWGTPGTYYWHVEGIYVEANVGPCPPCLHLVPELSPMFAFTVTAPPTSIAPQPELPAAGQPTVPSAPVLGLDQARADVASIIAARIGRRAHHFSDSCLSTGAAAATCRTSWTSAWPLSAHARIYSGTFDLAQGTAGLVYRFSGRSVLAHCKRRSHGRRCVSQLHWTSGA